MSENYYNSGEISRFNHGYEPQSKFWKPIPQQTAGYYIPAYAENLANKLLCASLLKFEFHYPPLCGIVQLTNSHTTSLVGIGVSQIKKFQLINL